MKLKDFVKMFKNCSLLKEQKSTLAGAEMAPNMSMPEDSPEEEENYYEKTISSIEKAAETPVDSDQEEQPDEKELPKSVSSIYDGSTTPNWLKSGAGLRLLTIMQDFGTEEEIQNSMDLMIRAAIITVGLPSPKEGVEISDKEIKDLQKKCSLKVDGDVGPATFGSVSLLVSKKYNPSGTNLKESFSEMFTSHNSRGFKSIMESALFSGSVYGVIDADKYIDRCASSKSLRTAVKSLTKAGIEVIAPPRSKGSSSAQPLVSWRDDKQFLNKAEEVASKHGMTRAQLLALIWHETAGTMSSRIENSRGFTGLIQFETMEGSKKARAKRLASGKPVNNKKATIVGLSRSMGKKPFTKKQLKSMTRAEQLDLVDAYIDMRFKGKYPDDEFMLGRIYCSIIYPVGKMLEPDEPVFADSVERFSDDHPYSMETRRKSAKAFEANAKAQKYRSKGYITIRDFQETMEGHIKRNRLDF